MQRHPLSALWGDMPPDELVAMRESVQADGFFEPVIWTYDGMVLDGWHRYTIANLLNLESGSPGVRWRSGAVGYRSKNLHRRHLTAVRRVAPMYKCLYWNWAKQGQQKRLA